MNILLTFLAILGSTFALRELKYDASSLDIEKAASHPRELADSLKSNLRKNADMESFVKIMDEGPSRRDLQSCVFGQNCDVGDTIFSGSCSIVHKKTDRWCDATGVCCASSQSGCCEVNPGPLAGVIIGGIVVLALIVVASCACCKCCPLYEKMCCAKKNQSGDEPN